jgi:hypothetical protein
MTLLDIGSGIRPDVWKRWNLGKHPQVCVEPCPDYVAWLLRERPDLIVVQARVQDCIHLFPDDSFDHVTMCDVIEHLERDEALPLLAHLIRIARVSAHVMTPIGFMEQSGDRGDGRDPWGLNGCEWQYHRSGWTYADFDGWEIVPSVEDGRLFEAHYHV